MVAQRRPFGVTLLAVLLILQGLLLLLAPLFVTGVRPLSAAAPDRTANLFALALPFVLGVLALSVAVGLWRLRPWARTAMLILSGVTVLNGAWQLVQNGWQFAWSAVSTILSLIILFYFAFDRDVRQAFGTAAGQPS